MLATTPAKVGMLLHTKSHTTPDIFIPTYTQPPTAIVKVTETALSDSSASAKEVL